MGIVLDHADVARPQMTRIGLLLLCLVAGSCRKTDPPVVVYCAQDADYAVASFESFEAHGHPVSVKYDTEANKSVSLAAEIEREAGRPRCDVHWNNEVMNTIRLARQGLYEPYRSPEAAGYPDHTRPSDGAWQAFAGRARVMIVNTNLVPAFDRPKSLADLADSKWKGKLAMAKPQFGTTATQAACLFAVLGPDAAKDFYRKLKANGVALLAGNKPVAERVAAGEYAVGLTDTDDAIIELDAGKPVALVITDEAWGTLLIPNTLALVKGGPNPARGKQLIDHLLAHEDTLATAGGYQIPLRTGSTAKLHPALEPVRSAKRMVVDFEKAADQWEPAQAFLRDEFAR